MSTSLFEAIKQFFKDPEVRPVRDSDLAVLELLFSTITAGTEHTPVVAEGHLWICHGASKVWHPFSASHIAAFALELSDKKVADGPIRMPVQRAKALGNYATQDPAHINERFFLPSAPRVFRNGKCIEVRNGELHVRPIIPDLGARYVLDSFDHPTPEEITQWDEYLDSLFLGDSDAAEKKECLGQFIGACLGGIAGRFEKSLILLGDGNNGKSQFLWLISQLFPSEVQCAYELGSFRDPYIRAQLPGKLINIATELPSKKLFASEEIKKITSCETTSARNPYGKPFNYIPIAGHIFACNQLPDTQDTTDGFWRRFLIIGFNRKFPEAGGVSKNALQKSLLKLRGAAFAWALSGLQTIVEQGKFHAPESSERERAEWELSSNGFKAWLKDCVHGYEWTNSQNVYNHYIRWCDAGRFDTMNISEFKRAMTKAGFQYKRTKTTRMYKCKLG